MARLKLPASLGWRYGMVVLLLATLSLALGAQNAVDNNRNTRCLALYSQRNAEVAAVRAAATSEKDAAVAAVLDPLVNVILDVTKPRPAPASPTELGELRAAAKRYKIATRELAIKRAANPLPAFPQRCSELNE